MSARGSAAGSSAQAGLGARGCPQTGSCEVLNEITGSKEARYEAARPSRLECGKGRMVGQAGCDSRLPV